EEAGGARVGGERAVARRLEAGRVAAQVGGRGQDGQPLHGDGVDGQRPARLLGGAVVIIERQVHAGQVGQRRYQLRVGLQALLEDVQDAHLVVEVLGPGQSQER